MSKKDEITVIGGGLAGVEAAWQAGRRGLAVRLVEMRPMRQTPAHRTDGLAELVCSNSLRSDDPASAIGLLHVEMRRLGSLVMAAADATRVPAGGALAVDRAAFSQYITEKISSNPLISLIREEATEIPRDRDVIVATGPLTDGKFAEDLTLLAGEDCLHFFDALAPIVYADSVDLSKVWAQSRWDKGGGDDYLNCPLNRDEYYDFVGALLAGRTVDFKRWEIDDPQQAKYFEGCLPIEVMAARGRDALAFGPMKPVGLTDPGTGRRPFAVVQLRKENRAGTLLNLVGFQTKLAHGEQERIFRTIPGLENARFARLGGLHRNSFVNAPRVLNSRLALKNHPNVRIAGQLSGCEGYVESASVGLIAGLDPPEMPPATTAIGAMIAHLTAGASPDAFQPMNVNFGLFAPAADGTRKADRKAALLKRAESDFKRWQKSLTRLSIE